MTSLPKRYIEDKAMRDAAKGVLEADLEHFKTTLAEQGLAGRVSAQITGKVRRRISAGARDVFAQAQNLAEDHRGVLAVLVGALVLWFAREPLLGLLGWDSAEEAESDETTDEREGT